MPTCNNYGNITTKKENQNIINYEYDNRFRLIKYKNEEIEYDQESLLPKRCTIKKENGIIESVVDYTWVTNRLTQIIKTSGNNITKIEFEYDQEGRRTSKQVTQNNIERYRYEYIYFNNILKYERRKENTILQYEIEYLYDENSNIYGFIYRKNQLIEKYLYKKDILGNILGILDERNEEIIVYTSDDYGNLISDGISSNGQYNSIKYKGYYYDEETELFWLSSRYYSPELGRFIQPADVSSLNPHSINGLNLYAYANNNPIGILYGSSGARGGMVRVEGKISLSVNSNISKSSFSFDPNLLGDWFAHNESLYSHGAAIVDVIRQSKGLEQLEVLSKISNVLMHAGYWLNVGLSAYNNFTNEELSRKEQWVSFTVDTIHNTGQTAGSYFLGGIPYAGPVLAIGVPITVDYLWSGELCIFGFDLDFVPAITIKGKTPEEWVKYWINSWFE